MKYTWLGVVRQNDGIKAPLQQFTANYLGCAWRLLQNILHDHVKMCLLEIEQEGFNTT